MRSPSVAILVLVGASAVAAVDQSPRLRPSAMHARYDSASNMLQGTPKEANPLTGRDWSLVGLPGRTADLAALRRPVTLRLEGGRVTGFSGCNLMTGTYTTQASAVTFKIGQTLMACPEPGASIERAFMEALQGRLSYAVSADRLTLTTGSGLVLEFAPAPRAVLEGRTWTVTGYNNGRQAVVSPDIGTRLTLSFADGTVSGLAGCNTFRGTYRVENDRITIGSLAATRKTCAEAVMTQEGTFLKALQSASRWTIAGDTLEMHRADEERVLTATSGEAK